MIYSSLIFIYAFLPLSLLAHKIAPAKYKELVLLILSLVFISFSGLAVLVFAIAYAALNYSGGLVIQRAKDAKGLSVIPLTAFLSADIGIMILLRSRILTGLSGVIGLHRILCPLGLSLVTLSAAGYLMDIYFGRQRAEKDMVRFGLFILMFPKIIMGPVLTYNRYARIMDKRSQSAEALGAGLTLFMKGLAKKVLAADNLYMLYSAVNGVKVKELTALTAWTGAVAYVLCLYFTLSGFADMGAGTARCFGYTFPDSFRYPLFSSRLGYFATKWHIQPVRWFVRYIERPLQKLTSHRWLQALISVSVCGIIGFWYRFNTNGLLCGLIFGLLLLIERFLSGFKIMKPTGVMYTSVLIILLGVLFSGNTVSSSMRFIGAMTGSSRELADSLTVYLLRSYSVLLLIAMYASSDLLRTMLIRSGSAKLRSVLTGARPVIVLLLLISCTALMSYSGSSDMILLRL
ncbi:MAG: hypothetical protein J5501_03995 [Ruminococcus sp.]|nr:hypothetical protein [Ruminococcus sp.]